MVCQKIKICILNMIMLNKSFMEGRVAYLYCQECEKQEKIEEALSNEGPLTLNAIMGGGSSKWSII